MVGKKLETQYILDRARIIAEDLVDQPPFPEKISRLSQMPEFQAATKRALKLAEKI